MVGLLAAQPSLCLMARRIVVASYLYYRHDCSMMLDGEFDSLCKRVADRWRELEPLRQWQLGSAQDIRASGFRVKVTRAAEGAAWDWMREERVAIDRAKCITSWRHSAVHRLDWGRCAGD